MVGRLGLTEPCIHVGGIEHHQRVALPHTVALLHTDFEYPRRHLARQAVVGHFHLALDDFFTLGQPQAHAHREPYHAQHD